MHFLIKTFIFFKRHIKGSAMPDYVLKQLKEQSAVVVKKEVQLRKAFNFFKNVDSIAHVAMRSLVMSPYQST